MLLGGKKSATSGLALVLVIFLTIDKSALGCVAHGPASLPNWTARFDALELSKPTSAEIAIFGDSLTVGWQRHHQQLVDITHAASVAFFGIAGDTTAGLVSRIACHMQNFEYEIAIIFIGTNDTSAIEETYDNIRTIALRLGRNGEIAVIVIAPLPRAGERRERNAALTQRLSNLPPSIVLLNPSEEFLDDAHNLKNALFVDGLHLTSAGYDVLNAEVGHTIQRITLGRKKR